MERLSINYLYSTIQLPNVFIVSFLAYEASIRQAGIMQSFFQNRTLGRRLREEYNGNKASALSSRSDSGFSSVVDCQHYPDKDIERALNPDDPGRLFPAPAQQTRTWSNQDLSPRGALAYLDTSIANCTDGVEVRHDKTKGADKKIFVVLSDTSNDLNPQKWEKSIRIWATCVCRGIDNRYPGRC